MMIFLCFLLCSAGLAMQALCEPKMLRFAKLQQSNPSSIFRIGRYACLLLALFMSFWFQPVTAIFLWAGAFSLSVLAVSLGWAVLARYREVSR
ncbi:hypothetical protein [Gluconobacter thailandicus]|uniref:hypothetical protein n=1 Tax=Gluconobacter thailandicus TaxID=257438 RepID=UPI0003611AB4|nr:hypothetical protein [Gluconobacter thailandicus]